jgi:hypothetical protein
LGEPYRKVLNYRREHLGEPYRKLLDRDRREHLGEPYRKLLYLDEAEPAFAYLILRDQSQTALLFLL